VHALPVLLLTVTACSLTACSGDDDTVAQTEPATRLEVQVSAMEGADPQRWTLTCEPVGGDHPDPGTACADLAREGMPFAPLSGDVCTEIYGGPQTAVVRGTYKGQPVSLELSRTDGCRIAQWDRLGAVLPATP